MLLHAESHHEQSQSPGGSRSFCHPSKQSVKEVQISEDDKEVQEV